MATTTQNLKTQSGNRVLVYMAGVVVGLLQSVRLNDDYSPEPASGIGDIHVQEYVPSMARHSLSVSNMVLKLSTLRSLGITPVNGDGALQGLVFDFNVVDKDTSAVLRKYVGCSYASGSTDVTKHQIVMNDGQFLALDVTGTGI